MPILNGYPFPNRGAGDALGASLNDIGGKLGGVGEQIGDAAERGYSFLNKDPTVQKIKGIVQTAPKGLLNALYPNEFEYYLFALELVNSADDTVEYFSFPVMPSQIRTVSMPITNIRKTITSIHVYKNKSFNPVEISIQGTFGRGFKTLFFRGQKIKASAFSYSTMNGVYKISPDPKKGTPYTKQRTFNRFVKSGYACTKILESMLLKSLAPDAYGKPHKLYMYNPCQGNNWQVEYRSFSHSQDESKFNVFPGYTMQFTAIADLDDVLNAKVSGADRAKRVGIDYLQKVGTSLARRLDFRGTLVRDTYNRVFN